MKDYTLNKIKSLELKFTDNCDYIHIVGEKPVIHIEFVTESIPTEFIKIINRSNEFDDIALFIITNGIETRYVLNSKKFNGNEIQYKDSFQWYNDAQPCIELEECMLIPQNIAKYTYRNTETGQIELLKQPQIEAINNANKSGYIWLYPGTDTHPVGVVLSEHAKESNDIAIYVTDNVNESIKTASQILTENTHEILRNTLIVTHENFSKIFNSNKIKIFKKFRTKNIALIVDNCNKYTFKGLIKPHTYFKKSTLIGLTNEHPTTETKKVFGGCLYEQPNPEISSIELKEHTEKSQIKSKKRVADHAEVFTNEREVKAMLNMIGRDAKQIESTYLEPACGTGNFLVEILNRKIKKVEELLRHKTQDEFELAMFTAVSAVYGIDIQIDNVETSRERMLEKVFKSYKKCFKVTERNEFIRAIEFVLNINIIQGNTIGQDPVIISKWVRDNDKFSRYEFKYQDLVKGQGQANPISEYESINYKDVQKAKRK